MNVSLMEQAVINLIDNAIKYSLPNDDVSVLLNDSTYNTTITVSDNGCGISYEHIPHLFERFYRVDVARSRDLGGTGLGLSIVKHIAQAHSGEVSVKSMIGKGSSFSIHIPTKQINKKEKNYV